MQHQTRLPVRAFIPFTILFFSYLHFTPNKHRNDVPNTHLLFHAGNSNPDRPFEWRELTSTCPT